MKINLYDLKCLETKGILVLQILTVMNPLPQLNGLRQCLDNVDNWAFDVFELERESDKNPLQVPSRPTSTISACMRSHLNVISVSQREFFNS